MYHFSRSIYRELAPEILEDRPEREGPTNHERVLRSCETCVERLATDWHYFAANPATESSDCRATTRRGTPCRRTPLPHNGYCPSHQHLAETEDIPIAA